MTLTLIVERRVFTGILHKISAIHYLFTRHILECMDRSVGCYNDDLVWELYSSYKEIVKASFDR